MLLSSAKAAWHAFPPSKNEDLMWESSYKKTTRKTYCCRCRCRCRFCLYVCLFLLVAAAAAAVVAVAVAVVAVAVVAVAVVAVAAAAVVEWAVMSSRLQTRDTITREKSGTRLFRRPRKQTNISAMQKHLALGCPQHAFEDGIRIWVTGEVALRCTSELLIVDSTNFMRNWCQVVTLLLSPTLLLVMPQEFYNIFQHIPHLGRYSSYNSLLKQRFDKIHQIIQRRERQGPRVLCGHSWGQHNVFLQSVHHILQTTIPTPGR